MEWLNSDLKLDTLRTLAPGLEKVQTQGYEYELEDDHEHENENNTGDKEDDDETEDNKEDDGDNDADNLSMTDLLDTDSLLDDDKSIRLFDSLTSTAPDAMWSSNSSFYVIADDDDIADQDELTSSSSLSSSLSLSLSPSPSQRENRGGSCAPKSHSCESLRSDIRTAAAVTPPHRSAEISGNIGGSDSSVGHHASFYFQQQQQQHLQDKQQQEAQYKELLSKLAESMKRSERSRAQIMKQRQSSMPTISALQGVDRGCSGGGGVVVNGHAGTNTYEASSQSAFAYARSSSMGMAPLVPTAPAGAMVGFGEAHFDEASSSCCSSASRVSPLVACQHGSRRDFQASPFTAAAALAPRASANPTATHVPNVALVTAPQVDIGKYDSALSMYYPKSLRCFLSGSQSTLTSELEQSRRQLAAYLTQMSTGSAM